MTAPPARCEVCGFVYASVGVAEAPDRIGVAAAALGALIAAPGSAARHRSALTTWSALEYAGHVRDVLLSMRERVILAAVLDQPIGTPIYREERFALGIDRSATPDEVAAELTVAARMLGRTLAALPSGSTTRTMVYSTQTPIDASIGWMAAQAVHETEHHLADVRSVLAGQ